MYEDNLATHEFLYLFYVKMEKKLNRIIELLTENKPFQNNNEIYETKDKMLEAINLLILSTDNDQLKRDFNYFASLIASTNSNDIVDAAKYCKDIRTKTN
jgi:hypothetical protein